MFKYSLVFSNIKYDWNNTIKYDDCQGGLVIFFKFLKICHVTQEGMFIQVV